MALQFEETEPRRCLNSEQNANFMENWLQAASKESLKYACRYQQQQQQQQQ